MEAVRSRFRVWYEGCVIQVILLQNKWVGIGIAFELIPLRGGGGLANHSLEEFISSYRKVTSTNMRY